MNESPEETSGDLTLNLTDQQCELLKNKARTEGLTVEQWVNQAVEEELEELRSDEAVNGTRIDRKPANDEKET